jgi:predicted CXXCH cytochrome family protein
MSIKKIFYIVFVLIIFSLHAQAEQEIITVNYPPDKTVMDLGLLSISASIPQDSADLIQIYVNGENRHSIVPSREFECSSVLLAVGMNIIDIRAIRNNKEIDKVTLEVFRRSHLISTYRDAPDGFKKDYFHMKDRSQCAGCHILESRDTDKRPVQISNFVTEAGEDVRKAATAESTCYSCHKKIISYPYVHGPASVWSCLTCHDPQAEPVYSVKKPDSEVCFTCHIEQKKDWSTKQHIHGPLNTGNCAICHSPHASENPFNLVQPIWELCVSCHAGKETGRHIIAGYVFGDSHPTRGKPDPLRDGKEMSCASCHNAHASEYPKLWALNARSAFVLCQKCHQK